MSFFSFNLTLIRAMFCTLNEGLRPIFDILKLNLILNYFDTLILPDVKYTFLHKFFVLFVRAHCFISTYIDYTITSLYSQKKSTIESRDTIVM